MRILHLEISFYLPGCQSLKEKRQRLGKIADKLGKIHQLALSETGQQDRLQHSTWTFVIVGSYQSQVDRLCSRIETFCSELDAVTLDIKRLWLK